MTQRSAILGLGILTLLLAGCSPPLTRESGMVRRIDPGYTAQCTFLGTVEPARGADRLTSLRKQVATRGGNALVISAIATGLFRKEVQGDAYDCDWAGN